MVKKTITYQDFNGDTVSEDYYFHLSKAELIELEVSHEGGLSEALQRIIKAEDVKSLIAEFKHILLLSYGQKSEDGRRFTKTQELRDAFESSEAYSALFMELVTDSDKAVEFIQGVIPAGMAEEAAKVARTDQTLDDMAAKQLKAVPEQLTLTEPRVITPQELREMPAEEMAKLGERLASGEVKLAE